LILFEGVGEALRNKYPVATKMAQITSINRTMLFFMIIILTHRYLENID